MKTLTKTQQQKNKSTNSKNKQVPFQSKATAATGAQPEQEQDQQSGYESYYKQLSEEVESVERHVRELRQTPGLEDLTEEAAQAQVDFMLRFSAWVCNQHLAEQLIATINVEEEIAPKSAKVSKVQKPKAKSNRKVTKSLSR